MATNSSNHTRLHEELRRKGATAPHDGDVRVSLRVADEVTEAMIMHEQNSDSHSTTILNNDKCSTLVDEAVSVCSSTDTPHQVSQSTNEQPTHSRTTTKRHQHRAPRESERRAERRADSERRMTGLGMSSTWRKAGGTWKKTTWPSG